MRGDLEAPGVLSALRLGTDEENFLVDFLLKTRPDLNADILQAIFQEQLLVFLDTYAGQRVKFPNRGFFIKTMAYIRIYVYCRQRGFSEETYDKAARVFKRRKFSVKKIVEKMHRIFESEG